MVGDATLFSFEENTENSLFDTRTTGPGKIDVVQMGFIGAESVSWEELFSGFDRLYAITYSSGIGFIYTLLQKFQYSEVIFGFEEVINYSLQEIMAYQLKTIERLRVTSSEAKIDLLTKIDNQALKLFVADKKLSHEKIYLLEANDGRKRVVMGSANMSHAAFTGRQRENICYIDGERAYEWYKSSFDELREMSSNNISVSALQIADEAENINEIPIYGEVKVRKAMVIEPTTEQNEDIQYVLDVKNLSNKLTPFVPKADKKGKIILSPETVLQTRKRLVDANIKEKELRSEYPQLVVDIPLAQVSLNDKTVDLNPTREEIRNDVNLFLKYMDGYNKFHGDVVVMQYRYYAFANWFFTTPFMAVMRNMAVKYNQNLLPYPVFGLVYGKKAF